MVISHMRQKLATVILTLAFAVAGVPHDAAAQGRYGSPTSARGYQARHPRPQPSRLPAPKNPRRGPRVVREPSPAEIARRRERMPESHNWAYTFNLKKTNAVSRTGHRNAANRQLARELKFRPELNARINRQFGPDSAARIGTGRNPRGAQWDHQGQNRLHLVPNAYHARMTKAQGQRGGGWAQHWKKQPPKNHTPKP